MGGDRCASEPLDVDAGTDRGPHLGSFAGHLGDLDTGLSEQTARCPFLVSSGIPLDGELFCARSKERVHSREPFGDAAGAFGKEHAFGEGLDHGGGRPGNRDGDAKGVADDAVLAEEHFEDDLVDLVVVAVVGDYSDLLGFLSEAVHATFALL